MLVHGHSNEAIYIIPEPSHDTPTPSHDTRSPPCTELAQRILRASAACNQQLQQAQPFKRKQSTYCELCSMLQRSFMHSHMHWRALCGFADAALNFTVLVFTSFSFLNGNLKIMHINACWHMHQGRDKPGSTHARHNYSVWRQCATKMHLWRAEFGKTASKDAWAPSRQEA
eukprot:3148171-Amphidinium_carterae.1